ncbi:hypothetical protein LV78_000384 [Actinosynnema pretiosum]|nr:hypothetical protein [Actinosynnema pretiosum]
MPTARRRQSPPAPPTAAPTPGWAPTCPHATGRATGTAARGRVERLRAAPLPITALPGTDALAPEPTRPPPGSGPVPRAARARRGAPERGAVPAHGRTPGPSPDRTAWRTPHASLGPPLGQTTGQTPDPPPGRTTDRPLDPPPERQSGRAPRSPLGPEPTPTADSLPPTRRRPSEGFTCQQLAVTRPVARRPTTGNPVAARSAPAIPGTGPVRHPQPAQRAPQAAQRGHPDLACGRATPRLRRSAGGEHARRTPVRPLQHEDVAVRLVSPGGSAPMTAPRAARAA